MIEFLRPDCKASHWVEMLRKSPIRWAYSTLNAKAEIIWILIPCKFKEVMGAEFQCYCCKLFQYIGGQKKFTKNQVYVNKTFLDIDFWVFLYLTPFMLIIYVNCVLHMRMFWHHSPFSLFWLCYVEFHKKISKLFGALQAENTRITVGCYALCVRKRLCTRISFF